MEVVILEKEAFEKIQKQLNEILLFIKENTNPNFNIIDNQEFIDLLKISRRTAQTWRDEGIISFSQVGSKIYYRMEDVEELIESNIKPRLTKKYGNGNI